MSDRTAALAEPYSPEELEGAGWYICGALAGGLSPEQAALDVMRLGIDSDELVVEMTFAAVELLCPDQADALAKYR